MRFGVFYELQLPKPWAPGNEHRLFKEALDQVVLADRLGYDHAWKVEHHFRDEYSHSSAPEVFQRGGPDQAHPPWPRHPPSDCALQSSPARSGMHRHARPALRRPRRFWHRRGRDPARARPVRHPRQEEARRGPRGGRADRRGGGRASARHRHARGAATACPRLSAAIRRQGSNGPESPRAHLRGARPVRGEGHAGVQGRGRGARDRQRRSCSLRISPLRSRASRTSARWRMTRSPW